MVPVIILVIIIVLIPFQFYFTFFFIRKNDLVKTDTYSHLRIAEEFFDYRGIISYHKSYFPNKKLRYTYPPLLHIILAVLQERTSITFRRALSLWLNLFFVSIFVLVLYSVFNFSAYKIALACGLYLINSLNYFETNAITPRLFGISFFFLAGVGIAQFYSGNMQYWPYIIIGSTGLFLSHRMGVQILLFFSVVFTIILLIFFKFNFFWLWLFLSISFMAAILFTKGQVFYVLKDHLKRIYLHMVSGNQADGSKKLGNPLNIIRNNPFILMLPLFIYHLPLKQNNDNFYSSSFIMIVICCVILFMSIFWIWGSGERHIIFISPFLLILYFSQKTIFENNLMILFLVLVLIVIKNLSSILYFKGNKKNRVDNDWRELASLIKKDKGKNLLIFPEINISFLTYATKKIIFSGAHDSSAVEFNRILLKRRLYDHSHIKNMAEEFNSDLVLIGDNYNNPLLTEYLKKYYRTEVHKCDYVLWKKNK